MRYYRKWKKIRNNFSKDLIKEMNPCFAMLIIITYASYRHRKHIGEIWYLAKDFKDFRKAYNKELFGTHLTGNETLFKSLYFACPILYKKYNRKIPEKIALGEAFSIAYAYLKKRKKELKDEKKV